jgi:hypothetical protein
MFVLTGDVALGTKLRLWKYVLMKEEQIAMHRCGKNES